MKKKIEPFSFHHLRLPDFFEFSYFIFGNIITLVIAQLLGILKPYNEAKASFDKLVDIFRRNPTLLLTEKVVEEIAAIRRKMILLKGMFKDVLAGSAGEELNKAKLLENVAHPYLKNIAHDTQTALAANAMEMADALRSGTNLSALTQLDLKNIVDEIATLAHAVGEKLLARGEEKAFRKELGNATDTRKKLEKQLRYLLYSAIPVHYDEATGALITSFEHTISDINGAIESFRHLVPGGGSDSDNPDEDEEDGGNENGGNENNPSQPDTQPANPPSGGGGFTDPDA
ncbi:MAG: DUF6261 family protein [Mediterranea sp.]|jgi:hypothetical protein|nr:DUF6261 family protein [Mediterranea sp.]